MAKKGRPRKEAAKREPNGRVARSNTAHAGPRAWINADIRRRRHVVRLTKPVNGEYRPRLANGRNTQTRRGPTVTIIGPGPEAVDDFSQVIPVAQGELDVIETYLGALLDDALGGPE